MDRREIGCEGGRLKGADSGSCPVAVCGIFGVDSSRLYSSVSLATKLRMLSSEVTFCFADMIDV
jgi:hypothetical protein